MSFVTLAKVRALVKTGLSDADLQVVIDREEAWLAGRIGALTGQRTITFYPAYDASLFLPRRTAAVTITDNAVAVTAFRFTPSNGLIRRTTGFWVGPVIGTFTPDAADAAAVEKGVIELVRQALDGGTYESESIGDYDYSFGENRPTKRAIVRSILLQPPAFSMRVRSSLEVAP